MIKVGLTGNIGSGKSIICNIFSLLGIQIYSADYRAKTFLDNDDVINSLVNRFSFDILTDEHKIDRKLLASKVFHSKEDLDYLNSIIHPLVKDDFNNWLKNIGSPIYIIHEAAILFETGFHNYFDKIIVVSAPEDMRVLRILERDKVDIESIHSRMRMQWPEDEKIKKADFIIYNDENHLVIPQVLEIHAKLSRE